MWGGSNIGRQVWTPDCGEMDWNWLRVLRSKRKKRLEVASLNEIRRGDSGLREVVLKVLMRANEEVSILHGLVGAGPVCEPRAPTEERAKCTTGNKRLSIQN